jgi:hypothetical protein
VRSLCGLPGSLMRVRENPDPLPNAAATRHPRKFELLQWLQLHQPKHRHNLHSCHRSWPAVHHCQCNDFWERHCHVQLAGSASLRYEVTLCQRRGSGLSQTDRQRCGSVLSQTDRQAETWVGSVTSPVPRSLPSHDKWLQDRVQSSCWVCQIGPVHPIHVSEVCSPFGPAPPAPVSDRLHTQT